MNNKLWLIIIAGASFALISAAYAYYHANIASNSLLINPPSQNQASGNPSQDSAESNGEQIPNEKIQESNAAVTTKAQPSKNDIPDLTLGGLDGKQYKLRDYGNGVLFINFWTTWCVYCVQEMPEFDRFNAKLASGGKGAILAINSMESASKVSPFVSSKGLKLPVLLDTDGRVTSAFGVEAYPTTFVFYNGEFKGKIPGKTDEATLERIVKQVTGE